MIFFRREREDACLDMPISLQSRPKSRVAKPHRAKSTKTESFNEREFFDRLDYITVRIFLLALELIGMYDVIKDHLK
jgi:hypothetical protein